MNKVPPWQLGDDVGLRLAQKADDVVRTEEHLGQMLDEISVIVRQYGFGIAQWGAWPTMRQSAINEQRFIEGIFDPEKGELIASSEGAQLPGSIAIGIGRNE